MANGIEPNRACAAWNQDSDDLKTASKLFPIWKVDFVRERAWRDSESGRAVCVGLNLQGVTVVQRTGSKRQPDAGTPVADSERDGQVGLS
jgi:hypothetical protein